MLRHPASEAPFLAMRVPALAVVAFVWLGLGASCWGVTFTVNSTADAVDANLNDPACKTSGNVCTLRAAIQQANASNTADTITLPAGTYTLTRTGLPEDNAV